MRVPAFVRTVWLPDSSFRVLGQDVALYSSVLLLFLLWTA
jgi:hypothetical protein